jgi:hypothetical protein
MPLSVGPLRRELPLFAEPQSHVQLQALLLLEQEPVFAQALRWQPTGVWVIL